MMRMQRLQQTQTRFRSVLVAIAVVAADGGVHLAGNVDDEDDDDQR